MGVVATGAAGKIQLYTGKNDFWATRDKPSGGCAYALMGSGALEISAAPAPPAPPAPPSPPAPPAMNCTLFGCTCQGFADYYGAVAGTGWGCAPQPAGKKWWSGHDCAVKSKAGFCNGLFPVFPPFPSVFSVFFLSELSAGPACKLPGHAPCDPSSPGPGPGPSGKPFAICQPLPVIDV